MKTYPSKAVVQHSYDEAGFLYFLKKGALKLTQNNQNGDEVLSYLIPRGSIFGLTNLLLPEEKSNEKIIALQDSTICKVPLNIMRELMDQNKDLNNHILKLSGLKIKKLQNKLEHTIFKTAEQRIREFIIRFAMDYGIKKTASYEVPLFLTNKDIAKLSNTHRQKVNEVMNKMKKESIIHFDKQSLIYYN